mgnify:CR=1 FL=1
MKAINTFIFIVIIVVLLVLYNSMFVVTQGEHAIILHLGKIVQSEGKAKVYGPGLHFKTPFINTVKPFDTRIQTLVEKSSRMLTKEQKYLLVDYYVKWRIENIAKYYTTTGGYEQRAEQLLSQKVNDSMRAEFGNRNISDIIADQRLSIMHILKKKANETSQELGIKVIDVRINAIDLPTDVSSSVFARMQSEREQVAAKRRSDGKAVAEAIRANADAQVTILIAKAKESAATVRAKGQSLAAKIYANNYSKDPEFYGFYRSLEAYQNTFNNKRDVIVLTPNSQFFHYFKTDKPAVSGK